MNVGVLGLGKLGLPLALTLASSGHRVLAYDIDEAIRVAVANRQPHVDEPFVDQMLHRYQIDITPPAFMADIADVVFVIVPTPSVNGGKFDDSLVQNAIASLAGHRRPAGPIVAVISTLSPGSSRVLLHNYADKWGLPFVYTPALIALGSVVHDLTHAKIQIIGCSESKFTSSATARAISEVWRSVAPDARQMPMSLESAEIAKLAQNVFSTLKVTFANQVGQVCDAYRGADVDHVIEALSELPHIGPKLLTPGAGYGGPCWPRDTLAWDAAGNKFGNMIHTLNEEHVNYTAAAVVQAYTSRRVRPRTFAVLGRNYKDGSSYRFESFGDKLIMKLTKSYRLTQAATRDADLVVIAMPLKGISLCDEIKRGAVVLDLWRTHGYLADCEGVDYVPFGQPRKDSQ